MKKSLFLTLLITLVAVAAFAQRPIPNRTAYVQEYSNCAQAIAPPSIIATGDVEIPCFQVIIQYSSFAPVPQKTNVQWHEFLPTALTTDSWCSPNSFRKPFATPGECAAWWFERLAPGYEHAGLATTQERTYCFWWMY